MASMVDAAHATPQHLSRDAELRAAILRISVAVDPIFSRAEFGVEQVDGPYPEEIHYLYALSRVKALEGGASAREAIAIEQLALLLGERSEISSEHWLAPAERLRQVAFLSEDFDITYKPDPDYKGDRRGGGGAEGNAGAPQGGDAVGAQQGGRANGGGSSGRVGDPGRGRGLRESDPPGVRGEGRLGKGAVGRVAPTVPHASRRDERQRVVTREQLEALGKKTAELYEKALAVRASNMPRPTIFVPRKAEDAEEQPDWHDPKMDQILRGLGRFAPQATAFLGTLFDTEEISVSSETTPVLGPYPEEVEFEASLNKLAAEILRSDLMAKDKVDQWTQQLLIEPRSEWQARD